MPNVRVTVKQRQIVTERAQHCCEYCRCQARFATQSFSVEHIKPQSQDGKTTLDNLALACQGCNAHKYTKMDGYDPATNEIVPLYHPRQQKWSEHFSWSNDYSLIIGLTPTGRVTVEALQLNREGLTNLRRVLYTISVHPPKEKD